MVAPLKAARSTAAMRAASAGATWLAAPGTVAGSMGGAEGSVFPYGVPAK